MILPLPGRRERNSTVSKASNVKQLQPPLEWKKNRSHCHLLRKDEALASMLHSRVLLYPTAVSSTERYTSRVFFFFFRKWDKVHYKHSTAFCSLIWIQHCTPLYTILQECKLRFLFCCKQTYGEKHGVYYWCS